MNPEARNSYRAVVLSVVAMYLVIGALAGYVVYTGWQTRHALCTFRSNLEDRTRDGQAWLASHPHGIPGIPVPTIRRSLRNQAATVKSLHSLDC